MKISVLIPYQPDGGARDRAFAWVRERYLSLWPDAEVCVGRYEERPFSRARAINRAARRAGGDVFVIADADLAFEPAVLSASLELLTRHAWVIPFTSVRYLTEAGTARLLGEAPTCALNVAPDETWRELCGSVGGINMVPRRHFEEVAGFDERFVDWGSEDLAFAAAMNTLCGPLARVFARVAHLWHPYIPPAKKRASPHFRTGAELYARYEAASGDPKEMHRIIQEQRPLHM